MSLEIIGFRFLKKTNYLYNKTFKPLKEESMVATPCNTKG
jgi:hypothetical protein